MRALLQRVDRGSVTVDGKTTGSINKGLLVYLGVEKNDTAEDLLYILDKVIHMRIFEDSEGKMNLSVLDENGEILVVSQFTLCADTRKGRRPSYNNAADPEEAQKYYSDFISRLTDMGIPTKEGKFAAHMKVESINSGPVTIILDSRKTV